MQRIAASSCRTDYVRIGTFILSLILFLAAAWIWGLNVARAADPAEGRMLARKWCSECHLVEPGGKTTDMAPAFATLANDPRYTTSRLRRWLFAPHPPMPQIDLTKAQTEAIVAYIHSLKQN